MCVAIYKPAGAQVNKEDMRLAHAANRDGSGFAIRTSSGVYIEKGLWGFEEFWNRYMLYQEYEALIHFRFATAGLIDDSMCHPFSVGHGGALIHNGHMSGYGDQIQSDTAAWVDTVLDPLLKLNPNLLHNKAFQSLLVDGLQGNKLAVMLPGLPVILIGGGVTEHKVWYSNLYYRQPVEVVKDTLPLRNYRVPTSKYWGEEEREERIYGRADEPIDSCEACHSEDEATYFVCQTCYDNAKDMHNWNV